MVALLVVGSDGVTATRPAKSDEEEQKEKPDSKEEPRDSQPANSKRPAPAGKQRVTGIGDALTTDADLYGIPLSEAKLGEAGDVITRDALEESSRIAIDDEAESESEQIKEDRHYAEYEEAAQDLAVKREAEERERQAAVKKAAETPEERPGLLLFGGALVVGALLVILLAMRKVRQLE
jgi:hypothetical protein